jgi:hypothetical protein
MQVFFYISVCIFVFAICNKIDESMTILKDIGMNKYFFSFLAIIVLATSCSKKPITTITPIDQASALSPKGLIYALPKTSVEVKVDAQYTEVIPGPYAKFAHKYLGVSNVPLSKKSKWTITDVSVSSYHQADVTSLFVVEPTEEFNVDFLKIAQEGLIIPAANSNFSSIRRTAKPQPEANEVNFVDLSPSPYLATEQTTHYSRVVQDSTFVRVPVHRSVVVERSMEDKAKEAADFIFSLRKRRMELLAGDADFIAEGQAAEAVLKEISRLEEEYLTLFTGKVFKSSVTHWFDFSPSPKGEETSSILFRFSEARGILPSSDLSGSPILISVTELDRWGGTPALDQLNTEKDGLRTDVVYYRMPVPLQVKINDSKTEFFNQTFTFYQFGPLLRMPKQFINSL